VKVARSQLTASANEQLSLAFYFASIGRQNQIDAAGGRDSLIKNDGSVAGSGRRGSSRELAPQVLRSAEKFFAITATVRIRNCRYR
jgi:hypothetical protein